MLQSMSDTGEPRVDALIAQRDAHIFVAVDGLDHGVASQIHTFSLQPSSATGAGRHVAL
jgi:hypothetical protein